MALILSQEAEQDLFDIWMHIAADSPTNADAFLGKLDETMRALADFTHIGVDRPELGWDLKSFPSYRYVLYYRVSAGDDVELVRVLHGSRDVQNTL